jgi:hypothetical protein
MNSQVVVSPNPALPGIAVDNRRRSHRSLSRPQLNASIVRRAAPDEFRARRRVAPHAALTEIRDRSRS